MNPTHSDHERVIKHCGPLQTCIKHNVLLSKLEHSMLAGRSWWAGTGNMLGLGNGPNVPCSPYPACQMDDGEVLGCGGGGGGFPSRD